MSRGCIEIFCERLKNLRKTRNITQKALAEKIGIAERYYQRLEYGETNPGLDIVIALANYFEVSIDYLVGKTTDKVSNRRREIVMEMWDTATPEEQDRMFKSLLRKEHKASGDEELEKGA